MLCWHRTQGFISSPHHMSSLQRTPPKCLWWLRQFIHSCSPAGHMQNCETYRGHTRAHMGIVSPRMRNSITSIPWNTSTLAPPCTTQIHPYPLPMSWTSERDTSGIQEHASSEPKRALKHCSPLPRKAKSSPSYSLTPSPLISLTCCLLTMPYPRQVHPSQLLESCLSVPFAIPGPVSQNLPHPQCFKMTFTFMLYLSLEISASSTSI